MRALLAVLLLLAAKTSCFAGLVWQLTEPHQTYSKKRMSVSIVRRIDDDPALLQDRGGRFKNFPNVSGGDDDLRVVRPEKRIGTEYDLGTQSCHFLGLLQVDSKTFIGLDSCHDAAGNMLPH